MQLQALRFLPEPEVNVLRNRVNLLNIVSQLFSDEESTQSVCLCTLGVQKVQRFKGSKVQMVFWKRFRISIIYFILIYITIYINITIFEYFMTPFEFGFWTFEPLMCKEIRIMLTLQSENSRLTILRRLTLFLRTLTSGSGKNLDACNCVYPNLDWCTIHVKIVQLCIWYVQVAQKLFKIL